MSLRIYGASDDLVEIEGHVSEEVGAYEKAITLQVGDAKAGGIRAIVEYAVGDFGVWRISVEPIDEDVRIPWPVSIGLAERGYSPELRIDCPDNTPVFHNGERLGP